jgi:hypothetical protein
MLATPGDSWWVGDLCGCCFFGFGFGCIPAVVFLVMLTQRRLSKKATDEPPPKLPEVGPRWSDRPSTQPTDAVQPSRDGTTETAGGAEK